MIMIVCCYGVFARVCKRNICMDICSTVYYFMSTTINNSIFNWCNKMKNLIGRLHRVMFRYIIGIIISISFVYLYNYFMPMSNWLTYISVEPLQLDNKIWEELFMVSTRNVKRQSHVHWYDVLICNNKNIYWRYSSLSSEGNITSTGKQVKSRLYDAKTPSVPTVCHIESTTTLVLDFWITKEQTLKSKHFYFIN